MPVNVNSDNRVADIMSDLKRHMAHCLNCKGAIKAREYNALCPMTQMLLIDAAQQFDSVIPRRLKAARKGQRVFYACPDLGAHSKAYAMTAEPLVAVGIQEGLF